MDTMHTGKRSPHQPSLRLPPPHPPLPPPFHGGLKFPRTLCATYALASHRRGHLPPTGRTNQGSRQSTGAPSATFDPALSASGSPPAYPSCRVSRSRRRSVRLSPPPSLPPPAPARRAPSPAAGEVEPARPGRRCRLLLFSSFPSRPGPSTWRAPRTTSPTCWRK